MRCSDPSALVLGFALLAVTPGLAADPPLRAVVEDPFGRPRIAVRHAGRLVARLDPNPGGVMRGNASVRVVAGNRVLSSWGCGTYCETTVLQALDGRILASFGHHRVSPDARLAVAWTAFDAPLPGNVDLIDLAMGRILSSTPSLEAWNTCAVRWSARSVALLPCDRRSHRILVALPRSASR